MTATDGVTELMCGTTVKVTLLLGVLLTVTTTGPVVAPVGTVVPMLVSFQLVIDAVVPLNVTVLDPCVDPNAAPLMLTAWLTYPLMGLSDVMLGAGFGAVTVESAPVSMSS